MEFFPPYDPWARTTLPPSTTTSYHIHQTWPISNGYSMTVGDANLHLFSAANKNKPPMLHPNYIVSSFPSNFILPQKFYTYIQHTGNFDGTRDLARLQRDEWIHHMEAQNCKSINYTANDVFKRLVYAE